MPHATDDILIFDENAPMPAHDLKQVLKALPPYFGGKRKMIYNIVNQFPTGVSVVDIMAGALNVAMASKSLGHTVVANDRMHGPYLIGKAMLENSTHQIDVDDLESLLRPTNETFIMDNFAEVHLPTPLARIVDNIRGNIDQLETDTRWVYLYLLYRFLTHVAPFNLFRYVAFVSQYNEGKQFSKGLQRYANNWDAVIADPLPTLRKFALQINTSIIPGTGTMYNEELTTFMNRGSMGDLLYFDPPYYGARVKYERGYEVIDQMMQRDVKSKHDTSNFNSIRKERQALLDVFSYAADYEQTLFSYWTKQHDRTWFAELFEEGNMNFVEVPLGDYKYSFSGYIGGTGEASGTIQEKVSGVEILYALTPK